MTSATLISPKSAAQSGYPAARYYRPELDALRFFAFAAVLIHHGPLGSGIWHVIRAAGGFGLSMFFFLSAYLITELLMREREQRKTICWRLFFVRRALRIWPLYYGAILLAVLIFLIPPHRYWVSHPGIFAMFVFMANWGMTGDQLGSLVSHLWSISVEEQFYLLWPPILKFGGRRLASAAAVLFAGGALVWVSLFSEKGWKLWYDTPVQLAFFGAGAITALLMHGSGPFRISRNSRTLLIGLGLVSLLLAAQIGGIGTDEVRGLTVRQLLFGYAADLLGCLLIFLGLLGAELVAPGLAYLGKISYGLYVFHLGMLRLSTWIISGLGFAADTWAGVLLVDVFGLLLSILISHFSYRYFETPFLKLKEQFTVIQSRPA